MLEKNKEKHATLYELRDDYLDLQRAYDDLAEEGLTDEEISERLGDQLKGVEDEFEAKVERIALLCRNDQLMAGVAREESARLAARAKRLHQRVEFFERYLLHSMRLVNKRKVEGALVTVSIRKAPVSAHVLDPEKVPEPFMRHVPEQWVPDKKALVKHYRESGEEIEGVTFITDKETIQIR